MDENKPRRSWYRKKRWWLAIWLAFPIPYLFAFWLSIYSVGRGWAPLGYHFFHVFDPIGYAAQAVGMEDRLMNFIGWGLRMGDADRDPDEPHIFNEPRAGMGRAGR